ncbi:exodeoxyribonuclease VII large subunit [Aliamphritea spongicola]|uniref:exodeoxyribonuclease VII large subunit n=1 Tax=Aliamphritea spongicola TaxID=707589 RepID=UPI00196B95C2|nr:exodeoxyribonuclease VII large subunit [Aliamphritea spongicola]MBN3564513.1 exodeoxyribonuclease VII large subunit [Aliamphritea spongicola]
MQSNQTPPAFTVSELNNEVKSLLESSFRIIQVEGELSNFVRPGSGHWYFTLKDSGAQVRCAMFKNRNHYLNYQPKNGDKVRVRAKVSLYPGRGDYQLICDYMEDAGIGSLQQAYEALKLQLQRQGLFDQSHKKTLPLQPKRLGIITSPTGAAVHDILTVLQRRFPSLPVNIYPARVQGNEATDEIVAAIETANSHNTCDVLIVGRGGGSLEDLWCFNEARVAEAIFNSRIPVISAVGHETDVSIADFVADVRAPTPSAAAEIISPDQAHLQLRLQQLHNRLQHNMQQKLSRYQEKLRWISNRLKHPGDKLNEHAQRLDDLELRLSKAMQQAVTTRQDKLQQLQQRQQRCLQQPRISALQQKVNELGHRLEQLSLQYQARQQLRLQAIAGRLNGVSPLATLERGYAITERPDGKVIQQVKAVNPGEEIHIRLQDGRIRSQVTEVIPDLL